MDIKVIFIFFEIRIKKIKNERIYLIEEQMDYYQVMEHLKKYAVVLDVVKEEQVGLIVHTLEAASYKKKFITNNITVKSTGLYNYEVMKKNV